MARKTASLKSKRAEAEAAEALEKSGAKKTKKKAAKRKTTRKTSKSAERRRLVWGVFSGTLKEEARFPFDQKAEAEAKLEQLRSRGKRLYFLQPIKEPLSAAAAAEEEARKKAEEEAVLAAKLKAQEEESVLDEDPDIDLDPTADVEDDEDVAPPYQGEPDDD